MGLGDYMAEAELPPAEPGAEGRASVSDLHRELGLLAYEARKGGATRDRAGDSFVVSEERGDDGGGIETVDEVFAVLGGVK
jgi:hypothetical protein